MPVVTIKRHVAGEENASKVQVIVAVCALGHTPKNDIVANVPALIHYCNGRSADQTASDALTVYSMRHLPLWCKFDWFRTIR